MIGSINIHTEVRYRMEIIRNVVNNQTIGTEPTFKKLSLKTCSLTFLELTATDIIECAKFE